jgi:hypothetical protein
MNKTYREEIFSLKNYGRLTIESNILTCTYLPSPDSIVCIFLLNLKSEEILNLIYDGLIFLSMLDRLENSIVDARYIFTFIYAR